MAWSDPSVIAPLAVAWDYLRLVHPPAPADAILVLALSALVNAGYGVRLVPGHDL